MINNIAITVSGDDIEIMKIMARSTELEATSVNNEQFGTFLCNNLIVLRELNFDKRRNMSH